MNSDLLTKHINKYIEKQNKADLQKLAGIKERRERIEYYKSWTREKILEMNEEDLYEYIAKLWAMLIWGNKRYYIDKLIQDNGFDKIKKYLADLVWGSDIIAERWDKFRNNIKGLGPAMMSEILCHVHPDNCIVWNRRAFVALDYLSIEKLPVHNYQLTGKTYEKLSKTCLGILGLLKKYLPDANLLTLDYFFWEELQVMKKLTEINKKEIEIKDDIENADNAENRFIHDEIRDKIEFIGTALGFKTSTEVKVAPGAKVDAVWEAIIGNMGKAIYVFEVQTKGSPDSLIMNLLKSSNNPAVQGVVAVSDKKQLEHIKREAIGVGNLNKKLKYWDCEEVLEVHAHLATVFEKINSLKLVPESFEGEK
jgi:hypothetical protein